MKVLIVAEAREGRLQNSCYEGLAFARALNAETAMFLVGSPAALPAYAGTLYFADSGQVGEYNPQQHKQLLLQAIEQAQPQLVVLAHSSYGWDLAPRVATALGAAQISEVVGVAADGLVVPACNAKLRRTVKSDGGITVVTLQGGAFNADAEQSGTPQLVELSGSATNGIEFLGYEAAPAGGVDLTKAEVVVSAGRGIGKPENLEMIAALAKALGGEYGASRPVVDSGWAEHNRQIGSTGQTVAPKLYVACGISGAIQHLAGMKKSEYIVAINTDKEAPIAEVADVLVVADVKQLVPLLTAKLGG